MKNWIQNIEEKAGEFFSSHIILICGVLVVVTGAICVTGHGGSWLTPCGAIVGACIAMYQWASDRRVKRSELLNELVTRFSKFDIEKMIHPSDDPDLTVTEPYRAVSEDEGMFDLLTFLSYVCHLYRSYVISKREFSSLQWDIVKVLESDLVYRFVHNVYGGVRIAADRPYHDLLVVGSQYCNDRYQVLYQELIEGKIVEGGHILNRSQEGGAESCDHVSLIDGEKHYKNHLEILNGIFHMGYRGHMRGIARLPDGNSVWFPKYTISDNVKVNETNNWVNVMSNDGVEIMEFWPSRMKIEKDRPTGELRYAFGMNVGLREEYYKFLGVFRLKDGVANRISGQGYYLYERISKELSPEKLEDMVNSIHE